jgi:hypothetical protein
VYTAYTLACSRDVMSFQSKPPSTLDPSFPAGMLLDPQVVAPAFSSKKAQCNAILVMPGASCGKGPPLIRTLQPLSTKSTLTVFGSDPRSGSIFLVVCKCGKNPCRYDETSTSWKALVAPTPRNHHLV